MKIKVTSVYVDDQEKALRFYTEVLGFAKKTDFSQGPYRWLTVASAEEPDGTELQLALNNNPAAKTRASRGQVARYYRRGGPTTCIWCFAIRPWLVSALTPCRSANICSNPPGVTPNTKTPGSVPIF